MKKILFTLIISLLFTNFFNAQNVPIGMKYQAVARDLSGLEISNKPISLKILLHGELNTSNIYYVETHDITTNEFGLFSLCIGEGNVAQGKFDKIPWDKENIWIEIAIKEDGDKNYTTLSNNKLLAVPYAYHANTAGYIVDSENQSNNGNGPQAGVPSQNWSLFGNSKSDSEKDKLGTTDFEDLVFVTDNKERMRLLRSGELEVRENAQFDKNVNIDGITKTDYLVVADEANDTIPDPYPRNGSIVDVRGLFIADSIAIRGGLDIGGNLSVHGDRVDIDKDLYVGRNVNLNINDKFSPLGETINYGKFTSKGQVTISSSLTGGDGNYDAYPLRVEGSDQGIAIKLNAGTPNNSNNFITFFNSSGGAVGRIEGETILEAVTTPEYIFDNALLVAEEVKAIANVVSAAIPVATVGTPVAQAGPCGACIAMAAADLVLASANLVGYNAFALTNLGVTYQSGSADYAEWLERMDPNENISAGDIIGVNGGKISKYTTNAQQNMVISTKPAILGNMPMTGEEKLYEKVAFMGQIPVKVRGIVLVGDYILPSGLNDGIGRAVSSDDITAEQYREIVGVAWSSSLLNDGVSIINMAIGLNANDVSRLVAQLENKFNALEDRIAALENVDEVSPKVLTTQESKMSRYETALVNMPPELNDEIMKEAILYLENEYKDRGINTEDHPRLNKLFTDANYRAEIIKETQEKYKMTYKNYLKIIENNK